MKKYYGKKTDIYNPRLCNAGLRQLRNQKAVKNFVFYIRGFCISLPVKCNSSKKGSELIKIGLT